MSDRAIVSGVLFRAPAVKISKNGKPYAFATIRSGSGDAARWWKVFVFSESGIEEISSLGDGEPIAVAGEFDAELYAPADSESRVSWKIVADAVLSARRKPKPLERKPKADKPARPVENAAAPLLEERGGRPFDDAIPF